MFAVSRPKVLTSHALKDVPDKLLISKESTIESLMRLNHNGKASTASDVTKCGDGQQVENGASVCVMAFRRGNMFFILTLVTPTMAAPPEAKPTPSLCKANLKEWSGQKTETLTIPQIFERVNMMVAYADEAHHHRHSDKKTYAYLAEFYRVHTELANRTFDFITKHNLRPQFDEEENGKGIGQTASKEN